MADPKVGSREEWLAARKDLLRREKEWTRLGDELAQARRALPRVRVEKEYLFTTASGPKSLRELFDGRSQLLVYHFMFGPSYETGCPTCSSMADTFDGAVVHVNARDATFICVSRAPIDKLLAYRARMAWQFEWASSLGNDFNFDLGASFTPEQIRDGVDYNYAEQKLAPLLEAGGTPELQRIARSTGTDLQGYFSEGPGFSSFVLDGGAVYHAYSTFARGVEFLMGYYPILDRAPKGRQEGPDFWIRRKDEYPRGAR